MKTFFYIWAAVLAVMVVWSIIEIIKRRRQRSESARKGWATRKARKFTPPPI